MNKRSYKLLLIFFIIIILMMNIKVNAFAESSKKEVDRNVNFKRITIDNGLSQSTIEDIFQDSKGYMWIATDDGLNKYNGVNFEVYRYGLDSEHNISGNYISDIKEDLQGNIWVGTSRGLNKINPSTRQIKTYSSGIKGCNLSNSNITEILIDSKNDIYVATENGLNKYDKSSDNFKRVYNSENAKDSLSNQFIYSIAQDHNGDYWIGTEFGLNKIIAKTNEIVKYYKNTNENSISDNFIYSLYADNSNNIWIGTYTGGLNKLNVDTNEIKVYKEDEKDSSSIAGNFIKYIIKDNRDFLWVATNDGLSMLDESESKNKFINYKSKKYDSQSIISDNILSLCEDKSGVIWVGTYEGISLFNPQTSFKNYKSDPLNSNSLSESMISSVYEDNDKTLWVGTPHEGVNVIDRKTGNVQRIRSSNSKDSISSNYIRDIVGTEDEIWIATENGLNKYDKKQKKFIRYLKGDENNILKSNDIRCLFKDDEGILWIGTREGLFTFDKNGKFKSYEDEFNKKGIREQVFSDINQDKDGLIWIGSGIDGGLISIDKKSGNINNYRHDDTKSSISYNSVKSIAIDSSNNIWIGTQYGLNKFNRESNTFDIFTEKDGLVNNYIYGILLDEEDNPWVSTNHGLSKYEVKNHRFVNFSDADGLQGQEFNGYSYLKAQDGEMFFGGVNGLTYFYPKDVMINSYLPDVVVDKVFNGRKQLSELSNINLDYTNPSIQFKFFMPDYINASKIQYKYRLKGLDDSWNFLEKQNSVSYTRLSAGSYTFEVMARNSTGEWSKPTDISFEVGIKPWESPVAYGVYTLILLSVGYIIWNRVKLLDSLVAQRTQELNKQLTENKALYDRLIKNEKYKNNYFVNLSHELRTPLNVIILTQQLVTTLNNNEENIEKDKLAYYMKTLRRNSDRLLNLINNIIDTSKIESGSYKLDIEEVEIVYLIEEAVLSMKDLVEANGIELIIDPQVEEKMVECDSNEIEKCVINLVANAIKFTEKGGEIEVNIIDLDDKVKISVRDTGIGIDEKYQKAIFDRFNQAYNEVTEEYGGSGLGLTLTRQLVALHNGTISVKSKVGEGSEFIITIPTRHKKDDIDIDEL